MADDDNGDDKRPPDSEQSKPDDAKVIQMEPERQKRQQVKREKVKRDRGPVNESMVIKELIENPELRNLGCHDTFSDDEIRLKPVPEGHDDGLGARIWVDRDDSEILFWFQRNGFAKAKASVVDRAIRSYLGRNSRSLAEQHFRKLPRWDGVERLKDFFIDICCCAPEVSQIDYYREIAMRMFIGIVERVFEPGCQMDLVVILEGAQGIGKTSLLRIMAMKPEWFSDTLPPKLDRDARDHLKGKLIVELSEIAQLKKGRDMEMLKSFLTAQDDKQRGAFKRHQQQYKRQCIFVGTTNSRGGYLTDTTGNRRFLPILCGDAIDLERAKKIMPQLYAEAMMLHRKGETSRIPLSILKQAQEEQGDRQQSDFWREKIIERLLTDMQPYHDQGRHDHTVMTKDFFNIVGIGDDGEKQRAAEITIGDILRNLGGHRKRMPPLPNGYRPYRYLFQIDKFFEQFG